MNPRTLKIRRLAIRSSHPSPNEEDIPGPEGQLNEHKMRLTNNKVADNVGCSRSYPDPAGTSAPSPADDIILQTTRSVKRFTAGYATIPPPPIVPRVTTNEDGYQIFRAPLDEIRLPRGESTPSLTLSLHVHERFALKSTPTPPVMATPIPKTQPRLQGEQRLWERRGSRSPGTLDTSPSRWANRAETQTKQPGQSSETHDQLSLKQKLKRITRSLCHCTGSRGATDGSCRVLGT